MTLEEQIAWCNILVRATSMSDKPFAEAILKSLRSLEAAERDSFDLRQAAKLVILGDMAPDFVSLNINKSAWEQLQKAVWPGLTHPVGECGSSVGMEQPK